MIQLTKGYAATVDENSIEQLNNYRWSANVTVSGHVYAVTSRDGKIAYMHRILVGAHDGQVVDHIDGDTLNNRLDNLRICTPRENSLNRKSKSGSGSKYLGVSRSGKYWEARVTKDGKTLYSRAVKSEKVAAVLYNAAASVIHGQFAKLNRVDGEDDIRALIEAFDTAKEQLEAI